MKEYNDAMQSLATVPNSPSSKGIEHLLEDGAHYFRQTALLCDKLRKVCNKYWLTAKDGDVTAAQQESVIEVLEQLAQLGENHVGIRRNMLTAIHYQIISVGRKITADIPVQAHGERVSIEYIEEEEMVRIEMPGIMPFKQAKGANYLYGKIVYHMSDFMLKRQREGKPRITIPFAYINIIHHYIEDKKSQYIPDFDNLERSCMINALQACGLFTDNSVHMELHEMTLKGSRNFTEVLIGPESEYPKVYEGLKKNMYKLEGIKKSSGRVETPENC